jgi:hypothetical protein
MNGFIRNHFQQFVNRKNLDVAGMNFPVISPLKITGSAEVASNCRTHTTSNGSAMWPAVADWSQSSLVVGVHLKPNCIIITFPLSRAKQDGFEQRNL